jgi:hypothetical protein
MRVCMTAGSAWQVYEDDSRDLDLTLAAVGVLGDVADVMGAAVAPLLRQPPASLFLSPLLQECLQADSDVRLTGTAQFTKDAVERVLGRLW